MNRIHIDKDIQPLSEFRSKVAFYLEKVKKSKRPLVITQRGKSAAVLMDVAEYEAMVDKLEVLEEIKIAETQIDEGKGIPHEEVKRRFAGRIKN